MTTAEENLPLTRADLREELRLVREDFHPELQHYATKADIAELRRELKGILQTMRWMMAVGASGLAALMLVLNFLA